MHVSRSTKSAHARRGRSHFLATWHADESGAVLLLSLAGVLILLLLSWTLYDTGQISRDKLDVQTAADTAAYSQAAVNARAMNSIAYANVAKRSAVGIHAQYVALWKAYDVWYTNNCEKDDDAEPSQACIENEPIYNAEGQEDYKTFIENNSKKYHLQDVIAIDNYQRYTHALAPWWSWAEAINRAGRNGATMAASFPAPAGKSTTHSIINSLADEVINEVGWSPIVRYTQEIAGLPVQMADYKYLMNHGMRPGRAFFDREYDYNYAEHLDGSAGYARNSSFKHQAFQAFPGAVLTNAKEVFGKHGRPWKLYAPETLAKWTTRTSNLVMTYKRQPELFDGMRSKYENMNKEYELKNEDKYRVSGYWGMARGEIAFDGGHRAPNLWHPRWTARLRPVALPGEFQKTGLTMSNIYHDMLPYLALSGILISGGSTLVQDSFEDLVYAERANRALGHSTVEGLTK